MQKILLDEHVKLKYSGTSAIKIEIKVETATHK